MAGGRPSTYTEELSDLICQRLANGESLRSVCRDGAMPVASTVFKWMREHTEFSKQYARAKEESADALLEDMLDIADETDSDNVQVARLRVDVRKWAASKLKPKKYGDKLQQELSGPDGKELPQSITISVVSPSTDTK